MRTFTAALCMLAAASASSSGSQQASPSSSTQSFLINYNFETYPQGLTSQTAAAVTAVNTYDLLFFNTLLVNQTQPPVAGVPCHTAPTCTVFSLNQALLGSLLTPGSSTPTLGPAYITSKYEDSPITYFDPYAFYYGCVVADDNGAASLPVSCNITATGFNSAGTAIYSQVFQFKATGAVLQPMNLGYFSQGWSGLKVQTLDFSVTNNLTTAALLDNIVASVYGPQNAAITIDF